jgi:hypothetical protein
MVAEVTAIRPFPPLNFPEADLADLRRRIAMGLTVALPLILLI